MIAWKNVLQLFSRSLIYSLLIMLTDFVFIAVLTGRINQIILNLSFVMLIEGGIALIVGGATVLYSPSVAKVSEVLFHSKPWNYKRQKEIEKQMKEVIAIGFILVFVSLLLSTI
jgi:hypothetical protein